MKKARHTEEQIALPLKQAETGMAVSEAFWWIGISEQMFYREKTVYGGLGAGSYVG